MLISESSYRPFSLSKTRVFVKFVLVVNYPAKSHIHNGRLVERRKSENL
jgi:hypothetical protein